MKQAARSDRKQVLGGLDLGGTKIQAVLLDATGHRAEPGPPSPLRRREGLRRSSRR